LQFATITLMVYDHAITLGKEARCPQFELFWCGSWSLSKFLYLLVRFKGLPMPVCVSLLSHSSMSEDSLLFLHCFSELHDRICEPLFFAAFALSTVIMLLCQAAVTLRVWYLFSHNVIVRTVAVGALCTSTAASFAMLPMFLGSIEKLFTSGSPTRLQIPGQIVWLCVPALIVHTLLFALKVYRFAQGWKSLHVEAPLRRFFKEGMLMYAFAMGSLVFSIICLSWLLHIVVLSSAEFFHSSSFPTAAVVVAVCRAMLSIRSLASTFHVDPEWLLNHAEMSRLPLREGLNKSEFCV
ncbi:hypothetical protein BKA82DRAFT_96535, partial [Pisolithus tinctorius]